MTRTQLLARLRKLDACAPAIAWLKDSPHKTLTEAWAACERADWMLWLAARLEPSFPPTLRLAACACAETALKYVPQGEDRPRQAIEVTRRYAHGQATDVELAAARAASGAATASTGWDATRAAALKDMAGIVRLHIPDPATLFKRTAKRTRSAR